MTLAQLQAEAVQRLIAAGIDASEARTEARLLLSYASGLSREELYLQMHTVLLPAEAQLFGLLLLRRERREPLAYILGEREFYGLTFQVTPAVLVPRPETEFLVEAVMQRMQGHSSPRLVDVGTGSGIIAVALARHVPAASVFATDISPEAIAVALGNAQRHSVAEHIVFATGDLLAPITHDAPFDAIVSNPPYIAPQEIETLKPEVRDFEPRIALGTHGDPLHFYRRLASEAPPLLSLGGLLAVEVGLGQAHDVARLWKQHGLTDIGTVRDYAGIERVVIGQAPSRCNFRPVVNATVKPVH